jgi:hypothetical protein
MRKFSVFPRNGLQAALAAALRAAREVLYVGWALTSLTFCGVIAIALL